MTLTEKVDALLKERGMNKRNLSLTANIPYSTIANWYKRGYEGMTLTTFRALCAFFGVTMDSMAFDDKEIEYVRDKGMTYTQEEIELVRGFRVATDETRDNMRYQARSAMLRAGQESATSSAFRSA